MKSFVVAYYGALTFAVLEKAAMTPTKFDPKTAQSLAFMAWSMGLEVK